MKLSTFSSLTVSVMMILSPSEMTIVADIVPSSEECLDAGVFVVTYSLGYQLL